MTYTFDDWARLVANSLEVGTVGRMICVFVFVLAFCVAAYAPQNARAQDLSAQPEIKAFVKQYVAAFNAKDVARLRSFYHPKSLACITPENKDFYDEYMAVHVSDPIPANYTFSVMPVNESNLKALESIGQQWPVPPAQELHIDYQQGEDGADVVVWLVGENGRWFDDFPCATDAMIKKYREDTSARKAAAVHYKALAAGIKEPLRSELLRMLREHETGRATDRYHQASRQDYKTSMYVINELKSEARGDKTQ